MSMRKIRVAFEFDDEIPTEATDEQITDGLQQMLADLKPHRISWSELPPDGDGDAA